MAICIDKYYISENGHQPYVVFYKDGIRYITDGNGIKKDSKDPMFYSTINEMKVRNNLKPLITSLKTLSDDPKHGYEYKNLSEAIEKDLDEKTYSDHPFEMINDDSFEIIRPWDKDSYELYQLQYLINEDGIFVCHAIIDPETVDVDSILECYGFENLKELKTVYQDGYKQFLAECAFELLCAEGKCIITPGKPVTWAEGSEMIRRLSGFKK